MGFLHALLFLILGLAGAAGRVVPEPRLVTSSLATVDEAISAMHVSHPYENSHEATQVDVDLIDLEVSRMRQFRLGQGPYGELAGLNASDKELMVIRYELGSDAATEEIIAAKEAGYKRIILITDLSESVNGRFRPGETTHSRFGDADLKDNPMGRNLQRLLDAGFKYKDKRFGIFSPPLYDTQTLGPDFRRPLMHHKEVKLRAHTAAGVRTYAFEGTANWTPNFRYNRTLEPADPLAMDFTWDHGLRMAEVFGGGGTIKDITDGFTADQKRPLRILYGEDGANGWQEIAFTDGFYDLNDRKMNYLLKPIMEKFRQDPANNKIIKIYDSHFVNTDSQVFRSIKEAMELMPSMRLFGVYDGKFVSTYGWGLTAALGGFVVMRPGAAPNEMGFASRLRGRIEAYVYQRQVDGRIEDDLDGPPLARHIWHDKTSVYHVMEDGKEWYYVFTGSFNNSNNVANAEYQVVYKLPGDSAWAKSIIESIVKPGTAHPEFSLSLEKGVLRDFLARLTGHSIFAYSVADLDGIEGGLRRSDLAGVMAILRRAAAQPSTMRSAKTPEEIANQLRRLEAGLRKLQELGSHRGSRISLRQFVHMGLPLAVPLLAYEMRFALDRAVWNPQLTADQITKRIADLWKALELGGDVPVRDLSKSRRRAPGSTPRLNECSELLGRDRLRAPVFKDF